jgi:transcriptional regulator with XRE-family HTH domain
MTADELRTRRLQLGLSQLGMSQALGVALGTYRDWEAGRHQPSGNLLEMAVAHIGCGFAYTSGQYERIKPRRHAG